MKFSSKLACGCPAGLKFHALNCPVSPGREQRAPSPHQGLRFIKREMPKWGTEKLRTAVFDLVDQFEEALSLLEQEGRLNGGLSRDASDFLRSVGVEWPPVGPRR